MKLRQKLAVVLASAMVITSVPVVTMAASNTSVSKVITVSNENVLGSTAPTLKIELKDAVTSGTQFYLTLENAKWDGIGTATDVKADGTKVAELTPTSETEATVKLTADVAADKDLAILLSNVKVTGEAKISVDGNDTEISSTSSPIVFANKSDSKATVTAKDDTKFYTTSSAGEKVGTVVITEQVAGSLVTTDAAKRTVEIDVEHNDFEFGSLADIKVKGSKGFSSLGEVSVDASLDNGTLVVVLPEVTTAAGKGAFEITGIRVKSTDKAPETGDLNVTVTGKGDTKVESKEVKVATVTEYGTELTVDAKDEVVAGKSTKVKLTYKELSADSTATGDVEFLLSQGFIKESTVPAGATKIYKDSKKPKAEEIIGFVINCNGTSAVDKFLDKAEIEIVTEIGMTGEIKVSTSGRFVEDQEVVVAEVAPNFTVDTEAMTLKVGQSKQVGGKLVLTEEKAGAFARGTKFEIEIPAEEGITLTELPEVSATNGMTVKASWKTKGTATTAAVIEVEVTKASKEAAEITIEDLEVKVDRTVPEGTYDVKLTVSNLNGTLEVEDFLVIGTPNTEDLASNGLARGTSSFVIGESKYTVNGVEKTMDAASYIQDPGYTMVPMRYVAEAFGVKASDILFSKGVTTIFAGNRTIQLTNGSDVAVVNGAQIKMSTKVAIKEGRTYAPIGEVAQLLGIQKAWDATSKTATFTNK